MSAGVALSLAVSALGVVVLAVALVRRIDLLVGVGLMLDLWIAAGLLRLGGEPGWPAIAATASFILVRKLVAGALRRTRRTLDRA